MKKPNMRHSTFFIAIAVACQSSAQEVAFADYMQPAKETRLANAARDTDPFFEVGITGYNIGVNFGSSDGYFGKAMRFFNWPANGDSANNGTAGLGLPIYATFEKMPEALDLTFMYKPENGAPKKFRIDLYNGTYWDLGSPTNGGIVQLNGTVGQWNRFYIRRINTATDGYGNIVKPTFRMMAIQNTDNNFPSFGGVYNTASGISFDNARITTPRRLNGFYKVTGTTNKNIGTFTLSPTGGALQYNDWIQNLGNVDIVNVLGFPNLGHNTNATTYTSYSSNLVYTYLDGSSVRQFGRTKVSPNMTQVTLNKWIGMGVTGNSSTDRFFSLNSQKYSPNISTVLRQVTTSVYSHYVRTLNDNSGYAAEVPINLGGEQIVAVGDFNGDAMDDIITRQGGNFRLRTWTNETGSWPNTAPVYSDPSTFSTYGYLKVAAVADINDDGVDDMILNDSVSGDVFTLMTTPSGGNIKWIFQMNVAGQEKIHAVADADNDRFPDIYTTRNIGSSVGEIVIRKLASSGQSVLSVGVLAQINYDTKKICGIGDINGDGSADVVLVANDAPYYSVTSYMVNPYNRALLMQPTWITNGSLILRPFYQYGSN